jgi:hypothetical protein
MEAQIMSNSKVSSTISCRFQALSPASTSLELLVGFGVARRAFGHHR